MDSRKRDRALNFITTLEAIFQLGRIASEHIQKISRERLFDKYREIGRPIAKWLDRSAAQVATLFQTYDQYIALINGSVLVATELFKRESSRLAALFETRTQFMKLYELKPASLRGA